MIRRSIVRLLLVSALALAGAGAARAEPTVDRTPRTTLPSGRLVVKFTEDSGLKPRAGGLSATRPAAKLRIEGIVKERAPGSEFAPRIAADPGELEALLRVAADKSGRPLPDLTAWAVLEPGLDAAGLEALAAALREQPEIETAFLEPVYRPSVLSEPLDGDKAEDTSDSGDFSTLQSYRGAAPVGVEADAVADLPGGRGQDVRIIDIEAAWYWNHEDLNAPFHLSGTGAAPPDSRYHGTATLGVLNGADNGFGVTGLAPESLVGGAGYLYQSLTEAIYKAVMATEPGDVILIEVHGPGPNANGLGDYGYVPVEYWQDNFEMVQVASAMGRVVVEAGGNGQQDLDDPLYLDLFDRTIRDSGAIYVGAGYPETLVPEWFTNHGSRFDVHAWGQDVVTTGYGDLQGVSEGFFESQWYTQYYSGTSSASAIVAGAVAVLQGLMRAEYGYPLDAAAVRDLLVSTGSPQAEDPDEIGPRPNLLAAWSQVSGGIGAIRGRVTDSTTGLPIENAVLTVSSHGRTLRTDDEGFYFVTDDAGPVTFDVESFFHDPVSLSVVLEAGLAVERDIQLTPLPRITVSGFVAGSDTVQLGGVTVTALGAGIASVLSRADGAYDLPGLPAGKPVTLLYHRRSGYGAHAERIVPQDVLNGFQPLDAQLRTRMEPFEETGGYHPSSTVWQWAASPAGPDSSFSMPGCWGVGSFGDYFDNANSSLTSTVYTFPGETETRLSFQYWCDTEPGYDGANLWIEQDGEWILLVPVTGYQYDWLYSSGGQPGWSGFGLDWRGAVFDLSGFDLSAFRLRWIFRSDDTVSGRGFFIDDLTFDFGDRIVAADPAPTLRTAPVLRAHPNPFNPRTEIAWSVTRPGRLRIDVHDARGRLVRTLLDRSVETTEGVTAWDGRRDDGRTAGSGLYLVKARDAAGREASRRVVLLK